MAPIFVPPASKTPRGAAPLPKGKGTAPRARWKRAFGSGAALLALFGLWNWLSVDETGQPVTQTSDEPQAEIEGLKSFLVRRSNGQAMWEFSARRITIAADGTSTLLSGINRAFLYRNGQPLVQMSAPRVRFSNLSNNLEALGGVNASGPDEFSFHTARALWINSAQIVRCPNPATAWLRDFYFQTPNLSYQWEQGVLTCPQSVEVRTEGAVFRGKNLRATLKTRQIELSGGVQLIFAPSAVNQVLKAGKKAPAKRR